MNPEVFDVHLLVRATRTKEASSEAGGEQGAGTIEGRNEEHVCQCKAYIHAFRANIC